MFTFYPLKVCIKQREIEGMYMNDFFDQYFSATAL